MKKPNINKSFEILIVAAEFNFFFAFFFLLFSFAREFFLLTSHSIRLSRFHVINILFDFLRKFRFVSVLFCMRLF